MPFSLPWYTVGIMARFGGFFLSMKVRLFFCLFFAFVYSVWGQEAGQDEPAWVLLQEGKRLLNDKTSEKPQVGLAISLLRRALFMRGLYPEAELGLARAYAMEGNLVLERLHLETARSQKQFFVIYNDYLEVLYLLARLEELNGNIKQSIAYYRELAFENPTYAAFFDSSGLAKLNELFLARQRGSEGLELIFKLYRFPYDNSIEAHSQLARIFYLSGAYDLSINHALFALVGYLSQAFERIIYFEPEFVFSSILNLVSKASEYGEARQSLYETNFWSTYLYLANATYALEPKVNMGLAFEMWREIVNYAEDMLVCSIASKQIQKPQIIKELTL